MLWKTLKRTIRRDGKTQKTLIVVIVRFLTEFVGRTKTP